MEHRIGDRSVTSVATVVAATMAASTLGAPSRKVVQLTLQIYRF